MFDSQVVAEEPKVEIQDTSTETVKEDLSLDVSSTPRDLTSTSAPPPPPDDLGPPPDDKGAQVRRHEEFARTIEAAMQEVPATREEKRAEADELEELYTEKHLEPGIALNISFEPQEYADYQGAELLIAPNDTKKDILFPLIIGGGEDTGPDVSLVDELIGAARALTEGRKVKKKVELSANDPIQFIIGLYKMPPGIQEKVVQTLGGDFGDLLSKARYDQLWLTEDTTTAALGLLKRCTPDVARTQIWALIKQYPFKLDFTVDRFEARLAWQMLQVLPAGEQKQLLDGIALEVPEDATRKEKKQLKKKNKKDNKLSRKLNARAQKNMSVEFSSGAGFDTYVGNDQGKLDKTTRDLTKEVGGALIEVEGKEEKEAVGLDSDRQALLAVAIDPALWEVTEQGGERKFKNPSRLKGTLDLVVQAEEGSVVADKVAELWQVDPDLFRGLGFIYSEEGTARHYQQVDDDTFSTALGRTIAGVKSVVDVISALSGLWGMFAADKGGIKISLTNIEKAFLGKYGGVHLDHTEEVKDKKGLVETLLGGAGLALPILGVLNVGPDEMLDILSTGKNAASRIQSKLNHIEFVEEQESGEDKDDPTNINKILLTRNDELGLTTMSIPKLAIAGQAAAFGTTSTKMGPSFIKGGQVQIRNRTADDGKQYVTIDLDSVELSQLKVMDQQSMMLFQKIALNGFHLEVHAQDAKPKSLLTQILVEVQRGVIQAIRMLPAGFWVSLGVDAAGMIEEGIQIGMTAGDLMSGDYKQVSMRFAGMSLSGFQDSRGNHIDELSIGETDLAIDQSVGDFDSWKERQKAAGKEKKHKDRAEELGDTIESREDGLWTQYLTWRKEVQTAKGEKWEQKDRAAIQKKIDKYKVDLKKLTDKQPEEGTELNKAQQARAEQIAWYNSQIARLEQREALYETLELKHQQIKDLTKELADLKKPFEAVKDKKTVEDKALDGKGLDEAVDDSADEKVDEKVDEVREPTKAEKKAIAAKSKELMIVQGEVMLLEGGQINGTLGEVEVKGLSYEGNSVGSAKMGEVTMKSDLDGEGPTAEIGTESLVITDLAMADTKRRDQLIASELKALAKKLDKLEEQLVTVEGLLLDAVDEGVHDPVKIAKKRQLIEDIADMKDTKGELEAELRGLGPLLLEYNSLRTRLTDHDHPLTVAEQQRYLQIRQTLQKPPSTTVGKVTLTDLDFTADVSDVGGTLESGSGATGGLSVGKVEVEDIMIDGGSEGVTTIKSVSATDATVDLRQITKTTEGEGGETKTESEGILGIGADNLTITGVKMDGEGAIHERTKAGLEAELAEVQAELDRLADQPQMKDITDRIGFLQARKAAIEAQLKTVGDKLAEPEKLQAFIDTLLSKKAVLKDHKGNERFRGSSYLAAKDGVLTARQNEHDIRYGKKGDPMQQGDMGVTLVNAQRWVSVYSKALETTRAAWEARKAEQPDHNTTDLSDESAVAFWKKDIKDLETRYATVESQLKTWKGHEANKLKALGSNTRMKQALEKLRDEYKGLVGAAKASGLELGVWRLEGMSAFVMQKAAKAQIDGFASTEIDKIAAEDINLDIGGLATLLTDETTENLLCEDETVFGPALVISSGQRKKTSEDGTETDETSTEMLGKLSIEGVRSVTGDESSTLISDLVIGGISGKITVMSPHEMKIEGLAIASLGMSQISWESADYGIETPGALDLKGITVDAHVTTDEFGAMNGSITGFGIELLESDAIKLRMDDYLFELGKGGDEEQGGKQVIRGLEMSDYDLATGVFGKGDGAGVKIGELSTSGLEADLGAGMVVSSKKLSAKDMKIKSVLTGKGKDQARDRGLEMDDDQKSDKLEELPAEYADRYELDIDGLSANDLRVQMIEDGIDVNIKHLRKDKDALKGFYYDMTTGDFGFEALKLRSLGIGPLRYAADGMDVKIMDLGLSDLTMSLTGNMATETREERDQRIAEGRALKDPMTMNIPKLTAKHVELDMVTYKTVDASGAMMDVTVPHATTDKIVVKNYDFLTNTMSIAMDKVDTDGLGVVMKDGLSESHISGGFSVDKLELGLLKDGSTTINLTEAMAKAPVSYTEESTSVGPGGDKTKSKTNVRVDKMDALSGDITMGAGVTSSDSKKEGGTSRMSFSHISLDDLSLPSLKWSAAGGDYSGLDAGGIKLQGLTTTGYTETKMVNKRIGDQIVPMPETNFMIEQLHVSDVKAQRLTYDSIDDRSDENNSDHDRSTDDGATVTLTNARLQGIAVNDLSYVGGHMVGGGVVVNSAETDVDYIQDSVTRRANPLLKNATTLKANALFINFMEGDRIRAGQQEVWQDGVKQENILNASDLVLDHKDGEGNNFHLEVPSAEIADASILYDANSGPDLIGSELEATIGRLKLLEEGSFTYTKSDKTAVELDSDVIDSKIEALDEDTISAANVARLSGIDWDSFLDTLNGMIDLDLSVDSDLDFEIPTEMIVFGPVLGLAVEWLWDPIDDVTVDPLGVDEAHIGIPIINGATNRTLIQLHSGIALNLLVEIVSALVSLIPIVGQIASTMSRIVDIPLDLLASTIPTFAAPDNAKAVEALKSQKMNAELMKGHDPALWEKYSGDIQTLEDVPAVARQMRLDGYSKEADKLEQVMQTYFAPKEWEQATFQVFLNNVNAQLNGGPLSGQSTFNPPGSTDSVTETYDFKSFGLDFDDRGEGDYSLGALFQDVKFSSTRSDDEGNQRSMSFGAKSAGIGATLQNLFPDGKIFLNGTEDPSKVDDTMTGTLLKGTELKGITAKLGSVYKRKKKKD